MYNLKYSYILVFLLFQFIVQTLGIEYMGSIISHSMSGNTITLNMSYFYYDYRSSIIYLSNTSCTSVHDDYEEEYIIKSIDGSTDGLSGCTILVSHKTVNITLSPWTTAAKGSIIICDYLICDNCTYILEKDLTGGGITVETDPYNGLIPYVNLEWPYFNLTPKPYGGSHDEEEFSISYDLGLPSGPSVQLYSPDWVASTTKSVLHITTTLVQTNVKRYFDFEFYTMPRTITISSGEQCGPILPIIFSEPIFYAPVEEIKENLDTGYYNCSSYFFGETTLYELGENCKLKPAEDNKLFLYPGKDHPLEELNYLEFNHTFMKQKVYFNYERIKTAHIQPIDHRLIFASMENGEKLELNVISKYPGICELNPTFTIEITKPDGCATEPTSSLSGTIFTITDICTPILYANPYTVKIMTQLGPNTYEDTFVYFYSQSHQSIDLDSPITQQSTGTITIIFSETINHTDASDNWPPDKVWDCDIYWFKPATITQLGNGCTVTKISNATIEIQIGTNTNIKKGDTIFFSDSFCLDCNYILTSSPYLFTFTLTHDDLPYWNPEIDHTITASMVDNTNGYTPQFTYTITKPSECTQEITLPQLSEVTISAADLCASDDPYIVHVRMDIGNFYSELQFQFIAQENNCSALCEVCTIEGICQSCNSSKSHIKQLNQGTECRCQDNYYYSSSAMNCQPFENGSSFDLCQSVQNINPEVLTARYNYCSSLSPINDYYDEIIDDVDILVLNTTYSGLPTGIFNLLLSCRLKNMTSSSPLAFLDYDNCNLNEKENGDYVVTFKISLDDIVNKELCSFAQSTTEEQTIFLYTCQIAQWFFPTESLPNENTAIVQKTSELQVSVDSKTMNKIYFSSNEVINITDNYKFVRDVNTTSRICDTNCDGANSGNSVILAGENITSQINIDGVLANTYLMSLLSVEFKFEDGTSSCIAENDCTQKPPFDTPGQMQLTCLVTKSANNLLLEILIKLDPVLHRGLSEEREKIKVLRSIIGPYTVCDLLDEECKKLIVEPSNVIEEIILDEKEEDGDSKEKSQKDKIIIGLVVGVFVMAVIIIGLIYFIRRLRRAKVQVRNLEDMKEDIKTKGIAIQIETERPLEEGEGLPNHIES